MNETFLASMWNCDSKALDDVRKIGGLSPDRALSGTMEFLAQSADGGRNLWGGFRNRLIKVLIDIVGRDRVEKEILRELPSFSESAAYDFLVEVFGNQGTLTNEFAEQLFRHPSTPPKSREFIFETLLLQSTDRRPARKFFSRLLNELAANATQESRDETDMFCMKMSELLLFHYGFPQAE